MKKINRSTKNYSIASWLIPTAFSMIVLTGLTMTRAQASNIIRAGQEIESRPINAVDLINLTNKERADHQLTPLSTNTQLTQAAQAKARDLRVNNYFDHHRPTDGKKPWDFIEETGYRWRVAGENLARGYQNNSQVVAAWMASDTHRKNILNPRYEEVGIATIESTKDGLPVTITVQLFGTPRQ